MPKIQYIEYGFYKSSQGLIDQAIEIIQEYQADGFTLTLRQLYYQFVARDILENNNKNYAALSRTIKNARLAGLIDWSAIVDRTRDVDGNNHFDGPKRILEIAAKTYKRDTRADQDVYIEVWIEKDALIGVIEPVCKELDIPFFACGGNVSESAIWNAAYYRFRPNRHRQVIILHLGDHDPSGIDMTRDNSDRLKILKSHAELRRIALNFDQIKKYNPPPNKTKDGDTRAAKYVKKYGTNETWELDALEPRVISKLIRQHVDLLTGQEKAVKC